ncbi:unnamed protein product [Peniophora sp. CBMAI 1063]|nr:unnamed protein product [Peniophora sp. CBMAI 1063]
MLATRRPSPLPINDFILDAEDSPISSGTPWPVSAFARDAAVAQARRDYEEYMRRFMLANKVVGEALPVDSPIAQLLRAMKALADEKLEDYVHIARLRRGRSPVFDRAFPCAL